MTRPKASEVSSPISFSTKVIPSRRRPKKPPAIAPKPSQPLAGPFVIPTRFLTGPSYTAPSCGCQVASRSGSSPRSGQPTPITRRLCPSFSGPAERPFSLTFELVIARPPSSLDVVGPPTPKKAQKVKAIPITSIVVDAGITS